MAITSAEPAIAGSARGQASAPYVWYAVGLLCVVNVFNYMDRMALSVLLPFIKADLELSDSELGVLVGLAFSIFYAVFGIPIARWADRGTRRNIVAISLATWSLMTALSGAAQNFWQLFATRMGVGVGEAGGLPPSQSIICDYVPLERRPGIFAIQGFGGIAGLMLGMALAGWLGETIGWRWAFVALGVPGLALALIVRLTLREPIRGFFDRASARHAKPTSAAMLRYLWRCKTYKLLIVFMAVNAFVQFGLYQWWPTFYTRLHAMDPGSAGVSLGIALGIGSGAGVLLGGLLANRAIQRDVGLPLMMSAGATVLALPTALASLFVPSTTGSILLAALTGFFWTVPAGPVIAAGYSVTTPSDRATAGAITILFTSGLGIGLGPVCVGVLSDLLTPAFGVEALRYALLAPIALHPLLTVSLIAAGRNVSHDLLGAGVQIREDCART